MDPVIIHGVVTERMSDIMFFVQTDEVIKCGHSGAALGNGPHCTLVVATLSAGAFIADGVDMPQFVMEHPSDPNVKRIALIPRVGERVRMCVATTPESLTAEIWSKEEYFFRSQERISLRKDRERRDAAEREQQESERASFQQKLAKANALAAASASMNSDSAQA